jgi:hypothetical protein
MYNTTSTTASKFSSDNKNNSEKNVNTEDSREIPEMVEDQRNYNFTLCDNEFIDAGFDSDTVNTYLLIVRRAANNSRGFFECISTTAKKSGISERQLKYCRKLLDYCNIIKITPRFDPNDHNRQTSSVITLIDKRHWNLNHEWRNAFHFGSKDYKNNKPKKGKNTRKTKGKKSGVQQLHGGGAATARDGVQQLHTEQDPDRNKITSEQDHFPNDDDVVLGEKIQDEATITTNFKNNKNSWNGTGGVVVDFTEMIKSAFRKTFYPNAKTSIVMDGVIQATGITIHEFWDLLDEIKAEQYPPFIIFKSGKNTLKNITEDFSYFILNKEMMISQYKATLG